MTRKALAGIAIVVGVLLSATAVGAQYQPGQPGLILTPSTGTPGTQIQAIGFGCARRVTVTLRIDDRVVATGTSADDDRGSFTITFTAPAEPGQYVVVASCRATAGTGETVVSSVLSVTPAPTTTVGIVTAAPLPITGSGDTMLLTRAGLALIAVGGLLVLGVRRRLAA